jgi:hypothetical protein
MIKTQQTIGQSRSAADGATATRRRDRFDEFSESHDLCAGLV